MNSPRRPNVPTICPSGTSRVPRSTTRRSFSRSRTSSNGSRSRGRWRTRARRSCMTAPRRAASKPLKPDLVRYPSAGPRPGGLHAFSSSLPRAPADAGGAHVRELLDRRTRRRPGSRTARGLGVEERLGARGRLLRGLREELPGLGRRREGGPQRPDLAPRLPQRRQAGDDDGPGRRRPLAHAGLRVPQLSRLRHHRLRKDQPGLWHERRLPEAPRRGPPARHPRHRRPRREPQRRRPPVVRLGGLLRELAHIATSTSGARPTRAGSSPGAETPAPGTRAAARTTTASSGAGCPT